MNSHEIIVLVTVFNEDLKMYYKPSLCYEMFFSFCYSLEYLHIFAYCCFTDAPSKALLFLITALINFLSVVSVFLSLLFHSAFATKQTSLTLDGLKQQLTLMILWLTGCFFCSCLNLWLLAVAA